MCLPQHSGWLAKGDVLEDALLYSLRAGDGLARGWLLRIPTGGCHKTKPATLTHPQITSYKSRFLSGFVPEKDDMTLFLLCCIDMLILAYTLPTRDVKSTDLSRSLTVLCRVGVV